MGRRPRPVVRAARAGLSAWPAFQEQGRWSDPDGWARQASPCRADCDEVGECDGGEKLMGVGGLAAIAAVVAVLVVRRRRTAG